MVEGRYGIKSLLIIEKKRKANSETELFYESSKVEYVPAPDYIPNSTVPCHAIIIFNPETRCPRLPHRHTPPIAFTSCGYLSCAVEKLSRWTPSVHGLELILSLAVDTRSRQLRSRPLRGGAEGGLRRDTQLHQRLWCSRCLSTALRRRGRSVEIRHLRGCVSVSVTLLASTIGLGSNVGCD